MNVMIPAKGQIGRPPKNPEAEKFYGKPLHAMFLEKLPADYIKRGALDTNSLAAALDVSRFTVYRWLNGESISQRCAKAIVHVSEGAITKEDLIPFMLSF